MTDDNVRPIRPPTRPQPSLADLKAKHDSAVDAWCGKVDRSAAQRGQGQKASALDRLTGAAQRKAAERRVDARTGQGRSQGRGIG